MERGFEIFIKQNYFSFSSYISFLFIFWKSDKKDHNNHQLASQVCHFILVSVFTFSFLASRKYQIFRSFRSNCCLVSFLQPSPQMSSDVTIHGVLLWFSLGFLMPVAILAIRMSSREEPRSNTRLKILFYLHVILQVSSSLFT